MLVFCGYVWAATCEKTVSIPAYDSQNTSMALVTNLTELNAALAADKQYVYVAPGNYFVDLSSAIQLTTSGTENNKKYLVYYDPENPTGQTHPVHMTDAKRAKFRTIEIRGASWWVLDRLTVENGNKTNWITGIGELGRADVRADGLPVDAGTTGPFTASTNNVLNRMLYQGTSEDVIAINESCHGNTIQNTVIRDSTLPDQDWVGIDMMAWRGVAGSALIQDTCIINNEIYNVNDGIQLFNHPNIANGSDYRRTQIVNNDIYVTSAIYTDGQGNLDPDGDYSASENALDIKTSTFSTDPADAVIVQDNRIWGYKLLDSNIAGSSDNGYAVIIHNPVDNNNQTTGNLLFRGNIITDSMWGVYISLQNNVSVLGNIVYNTMRNNHDGQTHPFKNSAAAGIGGKEIEVYFNLFLTGDFYWSWTSLTQNPDIKGNVIANFASGYYLGTSTGVVADYNLYYGATQLASPGTNDVVAAGGAIPNHDTKTFIRKRITAPEEYSIPYGLPTDQSALYDIPSGTIGATADRGIDDALWNAADFFGDGSALELSHEVSEAQGIVSFEITTNKTATCRASINNSTQWGGMIEMDGAGTTTHSFDISVSPGRVLGLCALCLDALDNLSNPECTGYLVSIQPKYQSQ